MFGEFGGRWPEVSGEAREEDFVFVSPSSGFEERIRRIQEEFAVVTDNMSKLLRESSGLPPGSHEAKAAREKYLSMKVRRKELEVQINDLRSEDRL